MEAKRNTSSSVIVAGDDVEIDGLAPVVAKWNACVFTELSPDDAAAVLRAGVTRDALTDAIAVASLFAVITRYADALDFAIPTTDEFDARRTCCSNEVTALDPLGCEPRPEATRRYSISMPLS